MRTEIMHDLLIVAKDGLTPTKIMQRSNLSWNPVIRYLKLAEAEGFIEKVEVIDWRIKPTSGWKTTEKGREYAQFVYEGSKLFREDEG